MGRAPRDGSGQREKGKEKRGREGMGDRKREGKRRGNGCPIFLENNVG